MNNKIIKIFSCPFHQDSQLIFNKKRGYFICTTCKKKYNLIYANKIEIPNFLVNSSNWKKDMEKGLGKIKSNFIKKIQGTNFKRKIENNKLVLDIGCGENARGNINLDCYIPNVIPKNFILANAEYLPFKKESIDIILSNYNLEHLINPAMFIQKAYEITKEKLEIVTDNSEWIGDIFFRLYGKGRIFNNEHYYKWSLEYMSNLIKRLRYKNYKVFLLNLSNSFLVRFTSLLKIIPRLGNLFYRDLKVEIKKS